jgi:hypothetical protein
MGASSNRSTNLLRLSQLISRLEFRCLRSLLTFASSAFSCRYNHDGYGQREDGASYISWGKNDVGLCLRAAGSLRDGRRTTLQHRERDASASGLGTTASGFRTCLVRPRSCTHGVGRLRHSANAPRPRFPLFLRQHDRMG